MIGTNLLASIPTRLAPPNNTNINSTAKKAPVTHSETPSCFNISAYTLDCTPDHDANKNIVIKPYQFAIHGLINLKYLVGPPKI